jgi:hypothetical protein
VARAQDAFLIDLHKMSGELFQTLGPDGSKKAFLHYAARTFPGQDQAIADDSHFSAYGAYELARCVVECIRRSRLPLAKELAADVRPFDPTRPDEPGAVEIPASPGRGGGKPEGK